MINNKKRSSTITISKEEYDNLVEGKAKKEKTTVQIRISKEKKKLWEEFVEHNPNFKDLSKLIRASVNDYIFPDYSKRSSNMNQIPDDFHECFNGSLSRIDNWKNYKRIRELEDIIKRFNKIARKDFSKEDTQKKLLDIQHHLLTVILEIASIIPENT